MLPVRPDEHQVARPDEGEARAEHARRAQQELEIVFGFAEAARRQLVREGVDGVDSLGRFHEAVDEPDAGFLVGKVLCEHLCWGC